MKASTVALRDQLLAALREAGAFPLSTDELAAKTPRRTETVSRCCGTHWRDNPLIELVECRAWPRPGGDVAVGGEDFGEHVISRRRLGPEVYQHLRAMERQGLCERVRLEDRKSVYWRAAADADDDEARKLIERALS